jgi:hypothetical protein
MRDRGDLRRPTWPLYWRLSTSDVFDMIEVAERDPKAFGREVREVLLKANAIALHDEAVREGRALGQRGDDPLDDER